MSFFTQMGRCLHVEHGYDAGREQRGENTVERQAEAGISALNATMVH